MFVGNFVLREIEDIGIQLRNIISNKFNGNLHMKINSQIDHLDLTLLITPLQLINPKKTSEFPNWVMDKILTNPLTIVPNSFFIEGLHNQLNTAIL